MSTAIVEAPSSSPFQSNMAQGAAPIVPPSGNNLNIDHFSCASTLRHVLHIAARGIDLVFSRLFRDLGLTEEQWSILVFLRDNSNATAIGISRKHGFDTGSVSRAVDILVWRGLLARKRSRYDRRHVLLSLTPTGGDLLNSIAPDIAAAWEALFINLDAPEMRSLTNSLQRLSL